MSQYLFLYRNGSKLSPEQMQQQMGRWMAWMQELERKGALASAGHPLERKGRLVTGTGAGRTVTDGVFAEAKDVIGGYSILEAKDLEHAVELTEGCPIFAVGGGVEVRPLMAM